MFNFMDSQTKSLQFLKSGILNNNLQATDGAVSGMEMTWISHDST